METCHLSDLPVGQCACRIHAPTPKRPPRPNADAAPKPFLARFPGVCPACEHRIVPGDLIVRSPAEDSHVHLECTDRA